MAAHGDVPEWRKRILEQKRQKEEEERRRAEAETARLSAMPAWKRALLEKQGRLEIAVASVPNAPARPATGAEPPAANASVVRSRSVATASPARHMASASATGPTEERARLEPPVSAGPAAVHRAQSSRDQPVRAPVGAAPAAASFVIDKPAISTKADVPITDGFTQTGGDVARQAPAAHRGTGAEKRMGPVAAVAQKTASSGALPSRNSTLPPVLKTTSAPAVRETAEQGAPLSGQTADVPPPSYDQPCTTDRTAVSDGRSGPRTTGSGQTAVPRLQYTPDETRTAAQQRNDTMANDADRNGDAGQTDSAGLPDRKAVGRGYYSGETRPRQQNKSMDTMEAASARSLSQPDAAKKSVEPAFRSAEADGEQRTPADAVPDQADIASANPVSVRKSTSKSTWRTEVRILHSRLQSQRQDQQQLQQPAVLMPEDDDIQSGALLLVLCLYGAALCAGSRRLLRLQAAPSRLFLRTTLHPFGRRRSYQCRRLKRPRRRLRGFTAQRHRPAQMRRRQLAGRVMPLGPIALASGWRACRSRPKYP